MEMTNSRLEALFQGALEVSSGEERTRFLLMECGDNLALRQRVEGLVAAHLAAGSFLDPSSSPGPAISGRLAFGNQPGMGISGVRVLRKIAEGGFAVVYLAEQFRPMRRPVALKVLKPGLELQMGHRRLKAEREALAALDHPNIVRIHEAGAASGGWPYLLLEWVRGPMLTHYADAAGLTLEKRLALFLKLCAGIAHAHAWKIIHQDIKPANILVPEYDGAPIPKLIDFGTAVFAGISIGPELKPDGFGGFVGTPQYMSPEQATGAAGGVDVRTDVFSLGVVLHELLTGLLPFETKTANHADPDLVRRAIRSRRYLKPSLLVAACEPVQMISLARQRQKNPSELGAALRGDLDAILSKMLAPDRTNRYNSVNDLANDIRSHLENRPVSITHPGWVIRSRKFVRRHAVSLAAAGIICGILAVAVCTALIQGLQSRMLEREVIQHTAEAVSANRKQEEARVQKLVSLGLEAIRDQDAPEAMAWFSQAARLASPGSQERQLHQERVLALAASVALPIRALQLRGPLRLLEFSPDATQLIALAENGECICWDWQADQIPKWSQTLGAVTAAEWSPAGTQVALGRETGVEIRDTFDGAVVTMLKVGERVNAIRFSPDGRELAVAGKTLRLWESTRRDWSAWRWEHPAPVFAIRYSADGNRLVSACDDHQARVFDLKRSQPGSNRLLNVFRHETGVTGFTADHCAAALIRTDLLAPLFFGIKNRLLTWSAMNELTVWDPAENRNAGTLKGTCLATRVAASPAGEWIAVTFPQGSAQLWAPEVFPGLAAARLKHQERICDLAFGPQGKWVLTASADRTARLWGLPEGNPLLSPLRHSSEVAHGAVSPNGQWIATAQLDGQIRVWRLPRAQEEIKSLTLGLPGRWTALPSPDGRKILLSALQAEGRSQSAALFHGDGSRYDHSQLELSGPFVAGAWAPNSDRLGILTCRNENDPPLLSGRLEIRKVQDLSAPPRTIELSFVPSKLAWGPNGNSLVVADNQGGVWTADPSSTTPLSLWIPPAQKAKRPDQDLLLPPRGNCLIRRRAHGPIEVWDAKSHQLRFTLGKPLPSSSHRWIALSANEPYLLITEPDGTSRVISLQDGRRLGIPFRHPGSVVAQGFSPDGRWVVTSGHDGCVRLHDWRTGKMICPPLAHPDEVFGYDFSTNGDWLATACRDGMLRVWDTKTGASLLSGASVNEPLFDVRLSANNRWAILMGRGSTVWICSLRIQQETTDWSPEELTILSETVSCLKIDHDQPTFLSSADWQERLARSRTLRPDYFNPTF